MIADFLIRPYTCAIIAIAVILFLAVDELEPNRRVAFVLQCAILATGGLPDSTDAKAMAGAAYAVESGDRRRCAQRCAIVAVSGTPLPYHEHGSGTPPYLGG